MAPRRARIFPAAKPFLVIHRPFLITHDYAVLMSAFQQCAELLPEPRSTPPLAKVTTPCNGLWSSSCSARMRAQPFRFLQARVKDGRRVEVENGGTFRATESDGLREDGI